MNQMKNRDGYLYVLSMSNGFTKVGRSANPGKRLAEHEREAGRYGVTITRTWVSDVFPDAAAAERSLIAHATQNGEPGTGNEYFTNLDFNGAVRFTEGIAPTVASGDSAEPTTIGNNLRRLVARSGLTVTTIAEHMGIGRPSLHTKMNGTRHLNMPEILGLARALDLTPSEVMHELTREDAA